MHLTLKGPRPFFYQKPLKIAISIVITKKTIKTLVLESNHMILYFTYLRSHSKNCMKFDLANWKILTFKVGKKVF